MNIDSVLQSTSSRWSASWIEINISLVRCHEVEIWSGNHSKSH